MCIPRLRNPSALRYLPLIACHPTSIAATWQLLYALVPVPSCTASGARTVRRHHHHHRHAVHGACAAACPCRPAASQQAYPACAGLKARAGIPTETRIAHIDAWRRGFDAGLAWLAGLPCLAWLVWLAWLDRLEWPAKVNTLDALEEVGGLDFVE